MHRLYGSGTTCSDVLTDGGERRGLVRAGLAVGAGLLLATLGLSLAAQAAHATTFPGTNGRIAGSGPLKPTEPLADVNSKLELFTMNNAFDADADANVPVDPDECRLTKDGDSEYNPRFSKDGKKVVYVNNSNLWTMQLDAQGKCPAAPSSAVAAPGDPKPLTVSASDTYVGGWCTKPNGEEWVVFQRSVPGLSFEVYKVQVDGNRMPVPGTEKNLTLNPASDSQPSVRPDCSAIAFTSNRAGASGSANFDVWVMGFDGDDPTITTDNPTNRTDCSALQESAPSWSPGSGAGQGGTGSKYRITFQSNRVASLNFEIFRTDDVDSDADGCGDNVKRLTYSDPSGVGAGFDVTGYDLNPSYSPDGTKICFHSGRAPDFRETGSAGIIGQWDIYVLDADNGEPHVDDPIVGTVGTASVRKTKRAGNDERCGWQEAPGP